MIPHITWVPKYGTHMVPLGMIPEPKHHQVWSQNRNGSRKASSMLMTDVTDERQWSTYKSQSFCTPLCGFLKFRESERRIRSEAEAETVRKLCLRANSSVLKAVQFPTCHVWREVSLKQGSCRRNDKWCQTLQRAGE